MNKTTTTSPWAWVPSLYFAESVPYVAVMIISLVMYKQMGLSNADITFYTSWLYLPWVIKPVWSPFIDVIKTKRWWIVAMQLLIGAAFAGVAFTIPTDLWLQATLACFWLMAFSSATHDIAADGFYMLGLSQNDQAFFVGIRSTFYRIATLFGQGLLVMLAGLLAESFKTSSFPGNVIGQYVGNSINYAWTLVFLLMALLFVAFGLYHYYSLPRPDEDAERPIFSGSDFGRELWQTIRTFVMKPQVVAGLAFMLFYRMPEGLLSKVASLFLIDSTENGGMGLTTAEYGFVQGTLGMIGLTLGGILGGIAISQGGLKRWLWPMVCAISLPNAVYVYLSYFTSVDLWVVAPCVFVEQFGYGFGFTAYMMFLIYYSRGEHKTSHYAICTAFMALSMMIPGLFAGELQEAVGYQGFFWIVMISVLATFVVSAFLKIEPEFGKKLKLQHKKRKNLKSQRTKYRAKKK